MRLWTLGIAAGMLAAPCGTSRAQEAPAVVAARARAQAREVSVSIIGQVDKPGRYTLNKNQGLLNLMLLAGGFAVGSDLKGLVIRRAGAEIAVDFDDVLMSRIAPPLLREGDVVVVPRHPNRVYIVGAVARVGTYEFKEAQSLADLLALAGGASPSAALPRASILRDKQRIAVDTRALAAGPGAPIIPLRDGDIVSVPRKSVLVLGEVNNSGIKEFPDSGRLTVMQALALAGGVRFGKGQAIIEIARRDALGKYQMLESYPAPADPADPRLSMALQDHDSVYISRRPPRRPPHRAPRREEPREPRARVWLLQP